MQILLLVFIIFMVIFAPIISIWAVNTLFALSIPINLATWFAAFWLSLAITPKSLKIK